MKLILESWRKFLDEEVVPCQSGVEELATFAHQGQFRRSGEPYITHPKAVAHFAEEFGYSNLIKHAAYLHDTLEDYKDPAEMAKKIDEICPEEKPKLLKIILELTHDKSVAYTDYVLSLSLEGRAVKLLDMYHNSMDLEPGSRQYNKYQQALQGVIEVAGGKPEGINDDHWAALTKQLGIE